MLLLSAAAKVDQKCLSTSGVLSGCLLLLYGGGVKDEWAGGHRVRLSMGAPHNCSALETGQGSRLDSGTRRHGNGNTHTHAASREKHKNLGASVRCPCVFLSLQLPPALLHGNEWIQTSLGMLRARERRKNDNKEQRRNKQDDWDREVGSEKETRKARKASASCATPPNTGESKRGGGDGDVKQTQKEGDNANRVHKEAEGGRQDEEENVEGDATDGRTEKKKPSTK